MSLVEGLLELARGRYQLDLDGLAEAARQRLRPTPLVPADAFDISTFPTYWCVPILVGDYVAASRAAVAADLVPFVTGCLVRHFAFDPRELFDLAPGDDLVELVSDAYRHSAKDRLPNAFDARFAAKCEPWSVLLALGTRAIGRESASSDYVAALRAITLTFSCLQIVDDWHDRSDDVARGHWNMWLDEPRTVTRSAIGSLVAGARQAVDDLRPHLLRRALLAQLADTVSELREIVEVQLPSRGPGRAPGPRSRVRYATSRVEAAVSAGIGFLAARLTADPGALWHDFEIAGVSAGSTECVSAFVAAQLADVPGCAATAESVVGRLLAQARPDGGWGYRGDVPSDCDSTAWVLIAAAALGLSAAVGVADLSLRLILNHQQAGGGFATYLPSARGSLTSEALSGWFEPEVSVTGSAVLALAPYLSPANPRLRAGCRYIAARQVDGRWMSYWWEGRSYATFMATAALKSGMGDGYARILAASQAAVLAARLPDGGWSDGGSGAEAFATSLAIKTLIGLDAHVSGEIFASALGVLLEMQRRSGSWPGTARMVAPGASSVGQLPIRDANEVVTTACALSALAQAARLALTGSGAGRDPAEPHPDVSGRGSLIAGAG